MSFGVNNPSAIGVDKLTSGMVEAEIKIRSLWRKYTQAAKWIKQPEPPHHFHKKISQYRAYFWGAFIFTTFFLAVSIWMLAALQPLKNYRYSAAQNDAYSAVDTGESSSVKDVNDSVVDILKPLVSSTQKDIESNPRALMNQAAPVFDIDQIIGEAEEMAVQAETVAPILTTQEKAPPASLESTQSGISIFPRGSYHTGGDAEATPAVVVPAELQISRIEPENKVVEAQAFLPIVSNPERCSELLLQESLGFQVLSRSDIDFLSNFCN